MSETRRRIAPSTDGERGSMSVATIPAAAGLLALAILLVAILGSATSDKRESTTSADAAALAAADNWDDHLRATFEESVNRHRRVAWWRLAGRPVLTTDWYDDMRAAASSYANRNGADLVDFHVDADLRQVWVKVRDRKTVPETSTQMDATATAQVEPTGGLCVDGQRLGYSIDGACSTLAPPAPTPSPTPTPTPEPVPSGSPTPSPTPPPTPTPPPFQPPQVDPYRSKVTLVD